MSEPTERDEDRLQRMLQRWGAEEAVRESRAADAERPRKKRPLLRWLPAAIAAGLLLASLVTFHLASRRGERNTETAGANAREQNGRDLRRELAALREELSSTHAEADAARERAERLAEQQAAHRRQLDELRAQLDAADPTALADAQREVERLSEQLQQERQRSEELAAELASARRRLEGTLDVAERAEQLQVRVDELAARLAETDRELRRAAEREKELLAGQGDLRAELEGLANRHAALLRDCQSAYLGWSDRPVVLGVRQSAVSENRLLQRASRVRQMAGSPETAELIDCVEVVLTRLMMLPSESPAAEETFGRLLKQTDCLARIDAALASPAGPRALRAWLTEAKLVLMGAGNVG
ncbi:MAG: hypothetical protein ACP5HU_05085 [Phycisphaerae bacterium]